LKFSQEGAIKTNSSSNFSLSAFFAKVVYLKPYAPSGKAASSDANDVVTVAVKIAAIFQVLTST